MNVSSRTDDFGAPSHNSGWDVLNPLFSRLAKPLAHAEGYVRTAQRVPPGGSLCAHGPGDGQEDAFAGGGGARDPTGRPKMRKEVTING